MGYKCIEKECIDCIPCIESNFPENDPVFRNLISSKPYRIDPGVKSGAVIVISFLAISKGKSQQQEEKTRNPGYSLEYDFPGIQWLCFSDVKVMHQGVIALFQVIQVIFFGKRRFNCIIVSFEGLNDRVQIDIIDFQGQVDQS